MSDLEARRETVLVEAGNLVREPSRSEECRIAAWVDANVQRPFAENERPVCRNLIDFVLPRDMKLSVLADTLGNDAVED